MNAIMATLDLLFSRNGTPATGMMRQALAQRSNTPSGAMDQVLTPETSSQDRAHRLWVVDRVIEPQTVVHFVEFATRGRLPSGRTTELALLPEDDVDLLQEPLSSWAGAPFDQDHDAVIERIMVSIGSEQDPGRLIPISKELIAMKARIWEGVMPLSERRWTELKLDEPENFSLACQYLCAVTNVFHYLNLPPVKAALRDTYNLIWGHLETFDAARATKTDRPACVTSLWHEYMSDFFDCISRQSHEWVMSHIERLSSAILEQLSNDTLMASPGGFGGPQFALANKCHDLLENAAQADTAIFLPMDGYKGNAQPSQDDVAVDTSRPYVEEPIQLSANTLARKADYYRRLKYLTRAESWSGDDAGNNGTAATAKSQIRAQARTRAELRGEPKPTPQPLWVSLANERIEEGQFLEWGYVAYRTCYEHTDEQWEAFRAKFDEDMANWGSELAHVQRIRPHCTIVWKDAKEHIDAAKQ